MAPTSEVRREVAAKLRGPFDVCECVGHTYINGTLYGMQVCARDELALRDGMRHLADLIDPTCHEVGSWCESGLYYPTICHHELSCGHTITTPYGVLPKRCDECGARILDYD